MVENIASEQVDKCKEETKVIEPKKPKFGVCKSFINLYNLSRFIKFIVADWRGASASTCSYSLRIPQLHSSTFIEKTVELDGILRRSIENQRLLKGYNGYTYQTV
jgi:hypothetical protein